MPKGQRGSGLGGQLSKMINKLREQRSKHADALQKIDDMFASLGITTHLAGQEVARRKPGRPAGSGAKRGPGRPPKNALAASAPASKKARRTRRTFKTTGTQSVIEFVKAGGAKGRTTAEVNKQWKSEGRSGDAYITLGQLVKAKKLKKEELKGQRGSRYTIA